MKRLKQFVIAFAIMCIAIASPLSGISTQSQLSTTITAEAAATPKISKTKLSVNVGKRYTLKVKNTKKKVKWSSSKKSVATVSAKGVVTAKKKGTATITAKVGNKKYTCKVTVKQPVKSIKLNKKSATLKKKGGTITLKATISPKTANNKAVTWKSSNKKVATVKNGKVTAVGNGTCTITATAKDGSKKKATCKITVKIAKVKVKKLTMYPIPPIVELTRRGETCQLMAVASPANATNQAVTWKSSNTKVAKVNSSGKVTAVGNGTCTVTATTKDGSNKKATCKVMVNIKKVVLIDKIYLNEYPLTLNRIGDSAYIQGSVTPSNATNPTIRWYSSNPEVATVYEYDYTTDTHVTAVSNGTTTITAVAADGSGVIATKQVIVDDPRYR